MRRFANVKDGSITTISTTHFVQAHEVPKELDAVSSETLITEYRVRDGKFVSKNSIKPANKLKVAFVSNYRMKCGIATYCEALFPEIGKNVADYRLFAEHNDNPTSVNSLDSSKVVYCWNRGKPLDTLVSEIKLYEPDIVLINAEYGIFPDAKYWLALMTQLSDYRVIVIMHSVFPNHYDKVVVEASIPEMIVHLNKAKDVLKDVKQIPGKVYVIPHGCNKFEGVNKLWNIYRSKHTFIQSGFGYRYKNWEASLKAVSILKPKYSDVFFTGIFSESDFSMAEHQSYFHELLELICKLGIQDNVGLIRGYQSDTTLDCYLRTNQAAVFPYHSNKEHEVYGASGAARLAMSKGLPVISSSIPHFQDIPTIKADMPEQIAEALDKLFSQPHTLQKQIDTQAKFLNDNSWDKVAKKFVSIFES